MTKNLLIATVVILIVLVGITFYQDTVTEETDSVAPQNESETIEDSAEETSEQDNTETESETTSDDTTTATNEATVTEALPETKTLSVDDGPNEVVVNMTGDNFDFSVKEIKVKKGDVVTINLESVEGFHDWVVDEFNAATERINEGETTSVTFVADKVGTFQYYCGVGKHRQLGMVGYLTVED